MIEGTRWASWNLGVFLCIRCAGFHRRLGTHISKVKSVTLDSWTDDQIEMMRQAGNDVANARFNPKGDLYPFPSRESEIEQYLRNKYETKSFASAATHHISTKPSLENSDVSHLVALGYDVELCQRALKASKGNLQEAARMLSGTKSKVAENRSSNTLSQAEKDALRKLKAMGFVDLKKDLELYRKCNGDLDETISLLLSHRTPTRRPSDDRKSVPRNSNPISELETAFDSAIDKPQSIRESNIADIMNLYDSPTTSAPQSRRVIPQQKVSKNPFLDVPQAADKDPFGDIDPFSSFKINKEGSLL